MAHSNFSRQTTESEGRPSSELSKATRQQLYLDSPRQELCSGQAGSSLMARDGSVTWHLGSIFQPVAGLKRTFPAKG